MAAVHSLVCRVGSPVELWIEYLNIHLLSVRSTGGQHVSWWLMSQLKFSIISLPNGRTERLRAVCVILLNYDCYLGKILYIVLEKC